MAKKESTVVRIANPSQQLFLTALRTLPLEPTEGGNILFLAGGVLDLTSVGSRLNHGRYETTCRRTRLPTASDSIPTVLPYTAVTLYWHSNHDLFLPGKINDQDHLLDFPPGTPEDSMRHARYHLLRSGVHKVKVDFDGVFDAAFEKEFKKGAGTDPYSLLET